MFSIAQWTTTLRYLRNASLRDAGISQTLNVMDPPLMMMTHLSVMIGGTMSHTKDCPILRIAREAIIFVPKVMRPYYLVMFARRECCGEL
jgi:hypothetical protein